jgi:hypothetical protein
VHNQGFLSKKMSMIDIVYIMPKIVKKKQKVVSTKKKPYTKKQYGGNGGNNGNNGNNDPNIIDFIHIELNKTEGGPFEETNNVKNVHALTIEYFETLYEHIFLDFFFNRTKHEYNNDYTHLISDEIDFFPNNFIYFLRRTDMKKESFMNIINKEFFVFLYILFKNKMPINTTAVVIRNLYIQFLLFLNDKNKSSSITIDSQGYYNVIPYINIEKKSFEDYIKLLKKKIIEYTIKNMEDMDNICKASDRIDISVSLFKILMKHGYLGDQNEHIDFDDIPIEYQILDSFLFEKESIWNINNVKYKYIFDYIASFFEPVNNDIDTIKIILLPLGLIDTNNYIVFFLKRYIPQIIKEYEINKDNIDQLISRIDIFMYQCIYILKLLSDNNDVKEMCNTIFTNDQGAYIESIIVDGVSIFTQSMRALENMTTNIGPFLKKTFIDNPKIYQLKMVQDNNDLYYSDNSGRYIKRIPIDMPIDNKIEYPHRYVFKFMYEKTRIVEFEVLEENKLLKKNKLLKEKQYSSWIIKKEYPYICCMGQYSGKIYKNRYTDKFILSPIKPKIFTISNNLSYRDSKYFLYQDKHQHKYWITKNELEKLEKLEELKKLEEPENQKQKMKVSNADITDTLYVYIPPSKSSPFKILQFINYESYKCCDYDLIDYDLIGVGLTNYYFLPVVIIYKDKIKNGDEIKIFKKLNFAYKEDVGGDYEWIYDIDFQDDSTIKKILQDVKEGVQTEESNKPQWFTYETFQQLNVDHKKLVESAYKYFDAYKNDGTCETKNAPIIQWEITNTSTSVPTSASNTSTSTPAPNTSASASVPVVAPTSASASVPVVAPTSVPVVAPTSSPTSAPVVAPTSASTPTHKKKFIPQYQLNSMNKEKTAASVSKPVFTTVKTLSKGIDPPNIPPSHGPLFSTPATSLSSNNDSNLSFNLSNNSNLSSISSLSSNNDSNVSSQSKKSSRSYSANNELNSSSNVSSQSRKSSRSYSANNELNSLSNVSSQSKTSPFKSKKEHSQFNRINTLSIDQLIKKRKNIFELLKNKRINKKTFNSNFEAISEELKRRGINTNLSNKQNVNSLPYHSLLSGNTLLDNTLSNVSSPPPGSGPITLSSSTSLPQKSTFIPSYLIKVHKPTNTTQIQRSNNSIEQSNNSIEQTSQSHTQNSKIPIVSAVSNTASNTLSSQQLPTTNTTSQNKQIIKTNSNKKKIKKVEFKPTISVRHYNARNNNDSNKPETYQNYEIEKNSI